MSEPKPYTLPDFTAEKELERKTETRLQHLTRLTSAQQKTLRRKYQDQIKKLLDKHKNELKLVAQEQFEKGRRQGLEEGHQSVQQALNQYGKLSQELLNSEKAFLKNAEKHIVSLALAVARKVIGREVQSDRNIVLHTVREALKRTADKTKIIVYINPQELENILSHKPEFQELDRNFPELEFIPDEKIQPGGCIVETRIGAIDGRIQSQFEEIERSFSKE